MSSKLVVVTGATGHQGSAVALALLAQGSYSVRGLTRDTTSAASRELTAKGAEMVQLAGYDPTGLARAFEGAYAVFGVTIPRHPTLSEFEQGKALVDACVHNKVPLFVWSSLPGVKKGTGGQVSLPLLDDKAAVDDYLKEVGQPAVTLHTGGFTENLFNQNQLHPSPSSPEKWEIRYPVAPPDFVQPMSYISKDLGPSVAAIITHWADLEWRERLEKEPVVMCSYRITGGEMAATVTRVTGKACEYIAVEHPEQPRVKEMWNIALKYWRYPAPIPPPLLVEMGVKFHQFEDFVLEKVVPAVNA